MTDAIPANINRHAGWHRFGKTFKVPTTPSDGIVQANLNYRIIKAPMSGQVETPMGTQLIPANGKFILFREPTSEDPQYRYLGNCGQDYEIVQNSDVAGALDRLAEVWPLDTVGATSNGKTIFMTLDAGMTYVHGEEMHQYFLAVNTNDGGTSMKIAYTPVMMHCTNVIVTGLASATVSASLSHSRGIIASLDNRVNIIQKLQKASFTTNAKFEALASMALSEEGTRKVLELTYPMPVKPTKVVAMEGIDESDIAVVGQLYAEANSAAELWEYYCQRTESFRSLAEQLFARVNDERPQIAGTPWALYNAIVESADYRKGADSVAESSLFGTRATEKKHAFAAVMGLVK